MKYEYREFRGEQWLWPKEDYHCWVHLTTHFPDIPEQILAKIGGADVVVQAGGNCGLYTAQYASMVNEVITFEPDAINYHCLKENLKDYDNVTIYHEALGNVERNIAMRTDRINTGASRVSKSIRGTIPQVPLDKYDIDPDLIHLDIEGMEKSALKGALRILEESHPAVAVEYNRGGSLLEELGYRRVANFGHDWLYQ
jgi:FkbM family methyltransferase